MAETLDAFNDGLELDLPDENGITLRDQLQSVERQTGQSLPRLQYALEIPAAVEHVVDWFWDLSSGLDNTGFGPAPLSYTEIRSWIELTHTDVTPFEIKLIRAMNRAYLAAVARRQPKPKTQV